MMRSLVGWWVEIKLLQRCGAGKTSVAAVGAHLVVAEGDDGPKIGLSPPVAMSLFIPADEPTIIADVSH